MFLVEFQNALDSQDLKNQRRRQRLEQQAQIRQQGYQNQCRDSQRSTMETNNKQSNLISDKIGENHSNDSTGRKPPEVPLLELNNLSAPQAMANNPNDDDLGRNEPSSIFNDSEKTRNRILANSVIQGFPTSFTYGDFYFCAFMLKLFVSMTTNLTLTAASAYTSAFFSITIHCCIIAITEVQSILGAQAYGRRDFGEVNLRFRQAVATGVIFFAFLVLIPSLFFTTILRIFLGLDAAFLSEVDSLIAWSLPAMLVRILNDNFKIFIQNHGKLKQIGYSTFLAFLVYTPVAYTLIVTLNLGSKGMGLSLLFYELSSTLVCTAISKTDLPPESLQFMHQSTPLTLQNLSEFAKKSFGFFNSYFISYLVWDGLVVIVGLTKSEVQIAAYGMTFNYFLASCNLDKGLIAYLAVIINEERARKGIKAAMKLYWVCIECVKTICAVLGLSHFVILMLVYRFGGIRNDDLRAVFFYLSLLVSLSLFISPANNIFGKILRVFGDIRIMFWMQLYDASCLVVAWIFAILLGLEAFGVVLAIVLVCVVLKTLHLGFLAITTARRLEKEGDLHEALFELSESAEA